MRSPVLSGTYRYMCVFQMDCEFSFQSNVKYTEREILSGWLEALDKVCVFTKRKLKIRVINRKGRGENQLEHKSGWLCTGNISYPGCGL